jgi:light-regulated signal transduction histidine kinase (bacteriophytochrome)
MSLHLEEIKKRKKIDADISGSALDARLKKAQEERRSDINKSKEAEAELKRRTAELELVNSELEAFTYTVSHDLRGPLNMLGQFAGMIIKRYGSQLEAEVGRGIQTIKNTADQMGGLIDDLLAFSRISREQMVKGPIDMEEIVNDVWQELAALKKAPVRFEVLDLPPAFGDRNLIRCVVYNLLSNAIKFSSVRRQPRIEVGGHVEGGFSFFHIKDNGAGFRQKDSHILFGVFKRLHGSEFEGTGVGLAIVQRIVHRHGGSVFAEGRLNRGATFRFSLPSERRS